MPARLTPLSVSAILQRAALESQCESELQITSRSALDLLVDDLNAATTLSAFGRYLAAEELVRTTSNALQLPECAEVSKLFEEPIVIGGLPRTGTTLLHTLLSMDAGRSIFTTEQAFSPFSSSQSDAGQRIATLNRLSPMLQSIHPMHANGPEECNALAQHTMWSLQFLVLFQLPTYERALRTFGFRASAASLPRLYSAVFSDALPVKAILKSPSHIFIYDQLLASFPDLVLVEVHRDPIEALASWCSLVKRVRAVSYRGPTSTKSDALYWFDFWTEGLLRASGCVRRMRRVTVEYEELVSRPLDVLERVYRELDTNYPSDARRTVSEWLTRNHTKRVQVEHYDSSDFEVLLGSVRVRELRSLYREVCAS